MQNYKLKWYLHQIKSTEQLWKKNYHIINLIYSNMIPFYIAMSCSKGYNPYLGVFLTGLSRHLKTELNKNKAYSKMLLFNNKQP